MNLLAQNYLSRGFWGDEAWTGLLTQLSVPEIIQVTGQDFHPPMYYLFVHLFTQLFGSSEAIRFVSLFFYLLLGIPVFFLAKELKNKWLRLASVVAVYASPIMFTFAFEARTYSLLAFLSACTTLFFWKALQDKKPKWWWLYFIFGSIGVYSHYYMWFILASHGFFWLFIDRKQFWRVFKVYFGILLVQLPWIPTLFAQVSSVVGNYWIGAMNERTHLEFFLRVTGGDIVTDQQKIIAYTFAGLLALSLVVAIKMRKDVKFYTYLWFWFIIPTLLPTLVSLYTPIFFYRYLTFSIIPIIFISFWAFKFVKKEFVLLIGAMLAFWLGKTDFEIFKYSPHSMREKMEQIRAESPTDDYAIMTYLGAFAEVGYYDDQQHQLWVSEKGLVHFSGQALLDKYVEKGMAQIGTPDRDYWLIEDKNNATFVKVE